MTTTTALTTIHRMTIEALALHKGTAICPSCAGIGETAVATGEGLQSTLWGFVPFVAWETCSTCLGKGELRCASDDCGDAAAVLIDGVPRCCAHVCDAAPESNFVDPLA